MSPGPRRATVSAPANIALVKYWGARDLERALPYHPSISMTLEVCRTVTTVEVDPGLERDEVWLATGEGARPEPAPEAFASPVRRHLDEMWGRIRDRTREGTREEGGRGPLGTAHGRPAFRVATHNTFPAAAGLASSASGFAALAVAACRALGAEADGRELSVLARLSGSGSAARSVLGGFVEWPAPAEPGPGAPDSGEDLREGPGRGLEAPEAPARQLAPAGAWDLRCVVAIVESGPKEVSSREGHRLAPTSPHFGRRLELVPDRLDAVRRAIRSRDLPLLGPVLERDALELHAVAMTSEPPIFYWRPPTLEVLAAVRRLRRSGTGAWATMDAGANVHVLCPPDDERRVAEALEGVPGVQAIVRDRVGEGPRAEAVDVLAEVGP